MEGDFQKSLQLFVTNGYCVFEDNVCVDLSGVLDGKLDYINVPFSMLFARARCLCGPYPIHWPTRLAVNRKKKRVDFRALENPSPVRNGFVWSRHLLFIFIL